MSLVELAIDDLRCIERAELELHPGINLIWGGNGSGKTSLLEGIFLLGRGRSFRTRSSERLIRHGQSRLVVFGRTGGVGGRAEVSSSDAFGFELKGSDVPGAGPSSSGARDRGAPASGSDDFELAGPEVTASESGSSGVAFPGLGRSESGSRDALGSRSGSSRPDGHRAAWSDSPDAGPGGPEPSGSGSDGLYAGDSGVAVQDAAPAGSTGAPLSFAAASGHWSEPRLFTGRGARSSAVSEPFRSGSEREAESGTSRQASLSSGIQSSDPGFPGQQHRLGQALGVQVSRTDGTIARISGANAKSLTELTQIFPVQVIDPGIHKLVEEAGHRRRRWMDWAVFHVEHQFGDWWLRYTRALKQRNAALRTSPAQAGAWDSELIRLGELIAAARGRFVEALQPYWKESVVALSGLEPELHYFKGWAQETSLAEALAASKARDESKRVTHPGAHRADVLIRVRGRPAREVLSRGQQKLVAVAMTLAQLHLVKAATHMTPTLLLDDPAAELDGEHLKRFIDQVLRLESQLILTSLQPESHLFGRPDRVFHVEQGRVKPA